MKKDSKKVVSKKNGEIKLTMKETELVETRKERELWDHGGFSEYNLRILSILYILALIEERSHFVDSAPCAQNTGT